MSKTGIRHELAETIRLTVGLACIQSCEWRSIKPASEPGVAFGDLQIEHDDGAVEPVLCTRRGANNGKSCNAQRCPIAVEFAPAVSDALARGVAARVGLPEPVVDVIKGFAKLVAMPDPRAATGKT